MKCWPDREEGGVTMSTKNLLVELFVEELPPKALKKLGEAFAAPWPLPQGPGPGRRRQRRTPLPRRAAWPCMSPKVAAQAADKPVQQKLMPVAVASTPTARPTPALLKKLAALGLDASVVPQLKRQPDGKAEALFSTPWCPARRWPPACRRRWKPRWPRCRSQGHELPAGRWLERVNFVRPAHALVALHGAEVVPVRCSA
jgi:glycyl-tRNA synthetase beta chain